MVAVVRGVTIALHVFAFLAAAGIASNSLPPQPWAVAQHDAQRTSRASVSGPLRANLRREYALGPAINTSAPVISRSGRVYFTATYCLVSHPTNGCVNYWRTIVVLMPAGYARLLDPDIFHGYTGTPAIGADDTIYVNADSQSQTIAFLPNGQVRWRSGPARHSPLIGPDGSVIVISGSIPSDLLFLDAATGAVQRTVPLPDWLSTDIALSTGGNIFYGAGRNIVSVDPEGLERWRFDTGELLTAPPVVGEDGTVYAGTRRVYALDAQGNLKWTFNPVDALGAGMRLALAADGTVLVQTFGAVAALTSAGVVKWERTDSAGLGIVVDSRGVSYYVGIDGLRAVGPLGGLIWTFPLLRPFNTIFGLAIGPDGTVFAVGNRFAYALAR